MKNKIIFWIGLVLFAVAILALSPLALLAAEPAPIAVQKRGDGSNTLLGTGAAAPILVIGNSPTGYATLRIASGGTLDIASGAIVNFPTGFIPWASVSKTGSSLADLATRSAADLSTGTLLAARMPAMTGDATSTVGTVGLTLATVNANVGTFASVTVNGKGLVTAAAALSGDLTTSGAVATLATVATGATTGSSTAIPVITFNNKGLVTAVTTAAVIAPAGTLTGTTLASNVVTSSLTTVGTLTGGATGAGFTVNLGTSTISGILGAVNGGTGNGFTAFSGPAASTKTFTLPNASAAILTDNAVVTGVQGGTGVANTGKTITLGGNLTTSGAFASTFTITGTTTVTFPTSGTLATTGGTVASITGTSGQILANGLTTAQTGAVTLTLPSALVLPGTINGNTLTTGTWTLTGAAAKTLTFSNSLTLAGTDATTMTFPTTSATIARTDAANTFTGHQTIEGVTSTGATGTGNLVFASSPTLTTPVIGVATGTSVTAPTGTSLTLSGGDSGASLVIGKSGTTRAFTLSPVATSLAAWGTTGAISSHGAATITDSSTASGSVGNAAFHSFSAPTLAATNPAITTTTAYTVWIGNGPTAGTNQTITNSISLAAQGNVWFNSTTGSKTFIGSNLNIAQNPALLVVDPFGYNQDTSTRINVGAIGLLVHETLYASNDTSASATRAGWALHDISYQGGGITSTNAMTYTDAAILNVGVPGVGGNSVELPSGTTGNVTITNAWGLLNAWDMRSDGMLRIGGLARSRAAWGTSGAGFRMQATTYTDTSTASGTVASAVFSSFATPVLAATNASITTTDAATVYVAGGPTAGTNQTITNSWGLWNAGKTRLDDTLQIGGTAHSRAGLISVSAGVALTSASAIWTDSTSTGTILNGFGHYFNLQSFNSSSATTITDAANVAIAAGPSSFGNVTVTNQWSLITSGNAMFGNTSSAQSTVRLGAFSTVPTVTWFNQGSGRSWSITQSLTAAGGSSGIAINAVTDGFTGLSIDVSGNVILSKAAATTTSVLGTTDSSSTTTGSLITAGGMGVAKKSYFGDTVTLSLGKSLSFASGTGTRAGNAVLVGGTVTVSNTTVTANTVVILTRKTSGGTIGTSITYTVSAGTSFTINSDNILDTSTFSYLLIENP